MSLSIIPFVDFLRHHRPIHQELDRAYSSVLNDGVFVLGERVRRFETAFAGYIGSQYAIGLASGTDALSLALLALGIRAGDVVVVPANAYPTAFGVTAIGAVPRLVDIDPETYTMDPEKLSTVITKKTKAIIPVHLYGQPADMEKIMAIAQREGVPVIEDCAQATGSQVAVSQVPRLLKEKMIWKKVGTLGDIGCFSFYPTKNLGCLGDGGMVVTNNEDVAQRIQRLRMYGESSRYNSIELGRNSRLDELQAAFLLVKLKHLDRWNRRRREIAGKYDIGIKQQAASSKNLATDYLLPATASYARHTYHLYVIRSKQRDQLKRYLEEQGVGTGIHYPTPIHLVPSMKYLGYTKGDFPESERACRKILSIPMYPELTDEEVQRVADAVNSFNTLRHGSQRQQE